MFLSCISSPRPHYRCKWICLLSIAVIGSIAPWFSFRTRTGSQPMLNMSSIVNWDISFNTNTTQEIEQTFHFPNLSHQISHHQSSSSLATEPLTTRSPTQVTTNVPLQPALQLCPEKKTEMTQTEVYSHFLNVCKKDVVPLFTFPTPLDDPKFHEGQRCVTVVANVILGGYDDFPFGIPEAWNSNGNEISYASSYGMCWFLFLDWNSSNKIIPLEYRNATIEVCPSCNISITKVRAWNVVVIPREMMPLKTVGRNSRLFKMLLHRAFTTAEVLVYMDGNFHLNPHSEQVLKDSFGRNSSQIERQFMKFVNESMSPGPNGAQPAWAAPKHPQRCTPYQEGLSTCVMGLSGDSGVQQMHHYYADGFPTIQSYYPYLLEGCWHIRDLQRVESSLMGCAWMAEYLRWDQPRDQLSFNYAMWKLSKCINMREEDFLRVGVKLANVVKRTHNQYHGQKRERYRAQKCGEVDQYSKQCGRDPQCKPCELLPVSVAETP